MEGWGKAKQNVLMQQCLFTPSSDLDISSLVASGMAACWQPAWSDGPWSYEESLDLVHGMVVQLCKRFEVSREVDGGKSHASAFTKKLLISTDFSGAGTAELSMQFIQDCGLSFCALA